MKQLIGLIPLLPLIGFAIIGLLNRKLSKSITGIIGSGVIGLAFICSVVVFFQILQTHQNIELFLFNWISAANFNAGFSFLIDPLSSIFLLVITGVGFLIHVYSVGYMHNDDGFRRFFAYLNLFIFFMLVLVMADNYLLMFVGWEGVGLCSYLLIGFWFTNTNYNNAAKKAFVMNRIGDLGFLLGILLIFTTFGSISFNEVFSASGVMMTNETTIVAITLLLFVGAMGKSAQIPLYTWLPDAMAGPTPVSALIHAATMVTAGIYMVVRSHVLYTLAPISLEVIGWIGIATSILAASIGVFQNDIKKVLAYSTVSQLGLMFAVIGVGAYSAAVFHVVTHAFFKALLFLGAGSVIHAMSGEQDLRFMGGLKKHLPKTHLTFFIATLAISGIPPLAGFFSKDEILAELYHNNLPLFVAGVIVSLLTCFYMFRLYYLTFFGKFRGSHEQEHHLHESPASMTIPLIILAIFSAIGGFIGFPHGIGESLGIHNFISHYLEPSAGIQGTGFDAGMELTLILPVLILLLAVIGYARNLFFVKQQVPMPDSAPMPSWKKLIYNKYKIDELYESAITKPIQALAHAINTFIEKVIVDGLVNNIGTFINWSSSQLRLLQSGGLGFYLFAMVVSMIAILLWMVGIK